MEPLRNQNLAHAQVTYWESPPQMSATVTDVIIVLGTLTFALQLCLVLFLMLRCWRLDRRIKEALKDPETAKTFLAAKVHQPDRYKQTMCCPHADSAVLSPHNKKDDTTDYFYKTSIHWDLVQSS